MRSAGGERHCRPDFAFVSGVCATPWSLSATGGMDYQLDGYGGNTARLRIQGANPFEDRRPLSSAAEYVAFRIRIAHSKSTGAGSCPGCADPVLVRLERVELFQPPELKHDPVLTTTLDRTSAYWQGTVGSQPSITSVLPGAGSPGTAVAIGGTGLTAASSVSFGGGAANYTVGSDTQIGATVPGNAVIGPVQVTTPFGTALSASPFIVPARIEYVLPEKGPPGTVVHLFGSDFSPTTAVSFNGLSAALQVISNTLLAATVPATATTGPLVVTNPAGTAFAPEPFEVGPPEGVLNLSWDDCGLAGSEIKTFACNTNSGPLFNLIGSFVPPEGVNELIGMIADVRITGNSLPNWWRHGPGQCRGPSLLTDMNFVSGPESCADFWQGRAISNYSYAIDYYGPQTARLRVSGSMSPDYRGSVDARTEYYGFRVQISRLRTVSDNSCSGCDQPMALVLEQMQLLQPATAGSDPIITRPFHRGTAYWQNVPGPMPTVATIEPEAGSPGTPVTFRGTHFVDVSSVRFANTEAAFSVPSDSVILTTVPAGARSGPVSVRTPHGTALGPVFTVAPRIVSFYPRQAPAGYDPVTINGFNFVGVTSVRFNGVEASFTVPSDTVLRAAVPLGVSDGPITVTGPGGTSVSDSVFRIGPLPPGTINLSWDDCGAAGTSLQTFACDTNTGPAFQLIGSFTPPPGVDEFLGLSAELRIESGSALPAWWKHGAGECRGSSSLQASFNFAASPTAACETAGMSSGGSLTYSIGFYGPNSARLLLSGSRAGTTPLSSIDEYYAFRVSLQRTNTLPGVTGCEDCSRPVRLTLNSIQLHQPAAVGFDPILVTPDLRSDVLWQAEPGPAPVVISFSPVGGPAGTPVTVGGTHFTGATAVRFGSTPASFSVTSDTFVQTVVPAGAITGPISVQTIQGTGTSSSSFLIAPQINLVTPLQAPVGETVRLLGAGFTGTTTVLFNGTTATFVVASDVMTRAVVPAGATNGPITVTHAGGSDVSDQSFTVGPLIPGAINLSWDDCGPAGSALKTFACDVNSETRSTLVASFTPPGGVDSLFGLVGDVRIASAGDLPDWWKHGAGQCRGTGDLSVNVNFTTGPTSCADPWNGGATQSFGYQVGYAGPNTARLTVNAYLPTPRTVQVGVEYYAFKVGIKQSMVEPNSTCPGCLVKTMITLQNIQLVQPAHLEFSPILTQPLDAKVTHWQGVPGTPPAIASFAPAAGPAGTPVTVTGSRFTGAFQVQFNTQPATFTLVSETQIDAIAPVGVRTGPIRVSTPDGTASSGGTFFGPPNITAFTPLRGLVGSIVAITGVNFTGATEVLFHGTSSTFTVSSDVLIRATVPDSAIDGPITVIAPGGTDVSDRDFDVTPVVIPPSSSGINLAWNDCGDPSSQVFACNVNSGVATAVASFLPPAGIVEFLGISADINIQFPGTSTVPDWWKHGTGQCRGTTGLATNFDFTAGPFNCLDFYFGQAAGGFAYDIGYGAPNRARLRVQCAVPFENRGPVETDYEWYAFKVNLLRSKSTGAGSCAGCDVQACLVLNFIQLFQPPEKNNDPVLIRPVNSSVITWQGVASDCAASSTPVLVSVVTAEATPDRVRLVWQTEDVDRPTVHRREAGGEWQHLATLYPDGEYRVAYEDTDITPGATYDYRLGVPIPAGELYLGETRVTVPAMAPATLALARVAWDGSAGALAVSLSLPQGGSASLELFDVNGRRLIGERLEGLGAGSHELSLRPAQPLMPGVFFARVTQNGEAASRRFVVVQ